MTDATDPIWRPASRPFTLPEPTAVASDRDPGLHKMNGDGAEMSDRVAQASGMRSAQAHCTTTEALALMGDHAERTQQSIEQVATAVLDGHIRFGD